MSKIILKNIEKSFNKIKVLNNINFEVEEGKVVSLLGSSGCGKTTTLKIIAGLIKPDSGEILLGEDNITDSPVEKRGTVIVFQDYLLFPHLNVEENIGFGLKMSRVSKKDIGIKVEKMLELVQLKGYNKKYPNELSGGQQQRVALARALAIEPKVLLLDEPFSSLDTKLREDMREFTLEIQRKLNITTILVTHDKEEALMSSDKIAIMLNGEIKQFGTPEELYERPNSIEVADFFGDKNYICCEITNGIFVSDLLSFSIEMEDLENSKAMIKPEDIKIYPKGTTELEGIILSRKYAGERVYYTILVRGMELKVISQTSKIYKVGDKISIDINIEGIKIFKGK
ncbi:ABC transporter ATP-binding protein [Tissierella praeacuta]|uniref:ABC transporter ATP-binding protein n=1 Tax=Tissierella praeacuta TaxID=43131 RepID=UPI000EE9BCC0|nr:ABC transporter ATP-binding protein [Tissierella praeacuta]MBU5256478.1 ABC transporter ATP-binding protein [Tissierella praeacuta]HAE91972.1 ABC transporter ATP-binding protein [Tissierella sp.]